MPVVKQLSDIVFFIFLGIVISCIFDIFRTLRKIRKKNSIYVVMIQDIIFFIIVTIFSIIYMINILKEEIRFYMFLAIFLGIILSRKFLSKILINIYSKIYLTINSIIVFLFVPLELIFTLIYKLLKKIIKNCCKLFFIMINLKCKVLTVLKNIRDNLKRRGLKNEKQSREKHKKKNKKEKKIS